jgi:lipoyl synthase
VTDAYAVLAGLDGIAFPADGAVSVARAIGRPFSQQHACCSITLGGPGRGARTGSCSTAPAKAGALAGDSA